MATRSPTFTSRVTRFDAVFDARTFARHGCVALQADHRVG
jgi:hypothetical protein